MMNEWDRQQFDERNRIGDLHAKEAQLRARDFELRGEHKRISNGDDTEDGKRELRAVLGQARTAGLQEIKAAISEGKLRELTPTFDGLVALLYFASPVDVETGLLNCVKGDSAAKRERLAEIEEECRAIAGQLEACYAQRQALSSHGVSQQ